MNSRDPHEIRSIRIALGSEALFHLTLTRVDGKVTIATATSRVHLLDLLEAVSADEVVFETEAGLACNPSLH